jgi:hypothetical protein
MVLIANPMDWALDMRKTSMRYPGEGYIFAGKHRCRRYLGEGSEGPVRCSSRVDATEGQKLEALHC